MLLLLRLKAEARSDPFHYLKGLFRQIGNTFFHGANNALRADRDTLMNAHPASGSSPASPGKPNSWLESWRGTGENICYPECYPRMPPEGGPSCALRQILHKNRDECDEECDEGFVGKTKGARFLQLTPCFLLARQGGLEPPTDCLEGNCSIRLSYWRAKWRISLFFPYLKVKSAVCPRGRRPAV